MPPKQPKRRHPGLAGIPHITPDELARRIREIQTVQIKPQDIQIDPDRIFARYTPHPGDEHVQELADSMHEEGQRHPITVRQDKDGTYTLVVGLARLQAAFRIVETKNPDFTLKTIVQTNEDAKTIHSFIDQIQPQARKTISETDLQNAVYHLRKNNKTDEEIAQIMHMTVKSLRRKYPNV